MHVIVLFIKTVSYHLRRLPPLRQFMHDILLYTSESSGEASILKIYLQDKFPIYGQFGKFSVE
jgi:hypothetical protein